MVRVLSVGIFKAPLKCADSKDGHKTIFGPGRIGQKKMLKEKNIVQKS